MRNHGAKSALVAKRRWKKKTETVEHEDIARRKQLEAINRKLRQGLAEALKEQDP